MEEFHGINITTLLSLNLSEFLSRYANGSSDALLNSTDDFAMRYMPGYIEYLIIKIIWIFIILLGAVGNSLVIFTMCRHGDRSATSYYIIDLALADLAFVLISFPLTSTMFSNKEWLFGEIFCKLVNYIILVTVHATCITLTAMTIDRYIAIVYPIRSLGSRTPKTSLLISLGIWIASLIVCIPYLIFYRQVVTMNSEVYCMMENDHVANVSSIIVVITTYVVPLIIIVACYSLILKHLWQNQLLNRREENISMNPTRSSSAVSPQDRRRKRVTKMVAIVVILFATFWLPIHAFNLCFNLLDDFPLTKVTIRVKIYALTLSYASSCLNPFVYTFMGDGFRRAFQKTFPQVKKCQQWRRIAPGAHSEANHSSTMETRIVDSRTHSAKLMAPLCRMEENIEEENIEEELEAQENEEAETKLWVNGCVRVSNE